MNDEAMAAALDKSRSQPDPAERVLPDGPIFHDLRKIEFRDMPWHDSPFLPAGELVTVNADGDTGKGLLAAHYAARFSRGDFGTRRMVLFAVAEDAFDTFLGPRLVAAGADLEYVQPVTWRRRGSEDALRIPDDIPTLEESIRDMGVGFLVIDPLLSHLSAQTNTHTDHEVKRALQPLSDLAHRTGCTVLGNGHFGKDKSGGARRAAMGSTAFTNTPRVGLAMAYDDEDQDVRVLEVIKSNGGPKNVARNYRLKLVDVDLPGVAHPVPVLVPEGPSAKSVDELIALQSKGKRIPAALVRELIVAELASGEKTRTRLDEVALAKLGAKPDTVYKSGLAPLKDEHRVNCRKDGFDKWYWRLTEQGA